MYAKLHLYDCVPVFNKVQIIAFFLRVHVCVHHGNLPVYVGRVLNR